MNVPANLKYSNDHEWCRIEGDTAVIGITDFAQSQLGDIVFVDVPTVGETLAAGEVFGSIEAVKTVKVKMSDPAEYDALLSAADYEKLIG